LMMSRQALKVALVPGMAAIDITEHYW
jgi:hypothetical protein